MAFLFVPAALRYFALMSPSHRMPSMIIHASMEHLIPSQKVYRASGAHQMLWAGSLQDKRQLAECGFRGHGPSDLERLCRRKDSFRLGILCGRCVNICVEHVARIQFNISKLHNWARYIAIWYKLAMSFSPPTLCLLAGPVVKGRQRSGKGHCQLQLLYSRKSNRLPTADHSRSIIWRTPPVATKEISGTCYCKILQAWFSLYPATHTSLKEFHRTGMSTGDLLRRQLCPHDGWSGWRRMKTRNARLDVQWCASIGSHKLRPFCNKVLHTLFANWNALQGRHARAFLRSHALETASDLWANLLDEWMRALAMSQLWLPRQTPRVVH